MPVVLHGLPTIDALRDPQAHAPHYAACYARLDVRPKTTWAALRSIGSWRNSIKVLTGASCGPDLVGPGRLTCSADPRGISHLPILGTVTQARSSTTRPYATLCHHLTPRDPRLSSCSVRWRTQKRTDAGGPSGAMDT